MIKNRRESSKARTRVSRGGTFLRIVAAIAACAIAGVVAADAKSEKALAKQRAAEIAQGEATSAQILAQNPALAGTPFNAIMDRVFARLVAVPEVAARSFPYEIHLLSSDQANAFCTPGGKVFVLSAFTTMLRDDENLWAAVLAHELAHAVRSHTATQQKQAKGLSIFGKIMGQLGGLAPALSKAGDLEKYAKAAEVADKVATGTAILSPFLMQKFSRDDEADADAQGMLYMAKAGFDPEAAIRLHRELIERFGDAKAFTTFLRSHPRESVRVSALEALLPQMRAIAATASAAANAPQETNHVQ